MEASGPIKFTRENYHIEPMTREYAEKIANWAYEGEYAFYSGDGTVDESFQDGDHFVCLDEQREAAGYFCFGKDARIPTKENFEYSPEYLDIGLGMRPDLCGRGWGADFIRLGLDYARKFYGKDRFRLSVASFNERAIKVYQRVGFRMQCQVINRYYGNLFFIMVF